MSRLMSNLFGKRARRSPYFLTVPKDSNIFWLPVLEAVNFLEKEQAIDFAHRLVVLLVAIFLIVLFFHKDLPDYPVIHGDYNGRR